MSIPVCYQKYLVEYVNIRYQWNVYSCMLPKVFSRVCQYKVSVECLFLYATKRQLYKATSCNDVFKPEILWTN